MQIALPPDPDDHHGCAAGSLAARAGNRHWIGASPSARHYHHRRADYEPIADVIHHAGGLSVLRQPATLVGWGTRSKARRCPAPCRRCCADLRLRFVEHEQEYRRTEAGQQMNERFQQRVRGNPTTPKGRYVADEPPRQQNRQQSHAHQCQQRRTLESHSRDYTPTASPAERTPLRLGRKTGARRRRKSQGPRGPIQWDRQRMEYLLILVASSDRRFAAMLSFNTVLA